MDAVLIKFRYRCKTTQESWGGQQSACFFGDSSADKDPVDSEIPLPAPNGIKLARFVLVLTRLPVF